MLFVAWVACWCSTVIPLARHAGLTLVFTRAVFASLPFKTTQTWPPKCLMPIPRRPASHSTLFPAGPYMTACQGQPLPDNPLIAGCVSNNAPLSSSRIRFTI